MRTPADTRRPGAPRALSVRARILAAVLVTAALGMLMASVTSYVLSRHEELDRVQFSLAQEVEEFREAIRLRPGAANPEDVLYSAIQLIVPDRNEAMLGIVNGEVRVVPGTVTDLQTQVQTDADLVAAVSSHGPDETIKVHEYEEGGVRWAYVSVPVTVEGSPDVGHFVAVIDVREAFTAVNRPHLTFAAVCLFSLVLTAIVGYSVAGRLLSPLRALRNTAQRITDDDLTQRIPEDQLSSRDEVADLGRTVNGMLDRLATSFDTQRNLLDDAGHELRTPITIVRGHLELMDPTDPDDVTDVRNLALDELDRMQRLVDDIMVLAKSRRPDFVQPAPVVLSDLLVAVLDKVASLAERNWTIDAMDDTEVVLDQQRVTQALVQLVANAIRFTEPGDVIALGGRRYGLEVRLWVRDEGAGIAPGDQKEIFDRFARVTDDEHHLGDGLGLAIVSAIARAHAGRIALTSALGEGSTFTFCLPVDPVAADGRTDESSPHRVGTGNDEPDNDKPDNDKPSNDKPEESTWQPS